jgi:hypothetical protein
MLAKEKLKDEFKHASYISLTTDGWTSRATTSYLAVTAHYILEDVWELQSALLGCLECHERHTAEYIKEELITIANEWQIEDKIYVCVTDNAANMKAAIRLTGWEHFPCIAHTLNLIVRASLNISSSVIKKVKCIAEYFHRSPMATKKFISLQEQLKPQNKPLKLKIDVTTRWNSTLDMIERISILQEPVEAALGMLHNPVESLSEDEWKALPEIIKILKPFKQLTEEFSSQKEVTISKVLAATNSVVRILNNLYCSLNSELSKQMLDKLILEFNSRFKNSSRHSILSKAALLDPRFKKLAFNDNSSYEYAKNSLKVELEKKISEKQIESRNEIEDVITPAPEEDSIWMEFDSMTSSGATSSTVPASILTMRQYMEEKRINRQENPLKWWQARTILYPELADLAKKYLSAMSTSVPSERIFSKSGCILSERRSSLKPKRMEKILFLNMNQRFLK